MQRQLIAIYPGTFDPITNGHLDLIRRAAPIFKKLVVSIAYDTKKSPIFSLEERVEIVQEVISSDPNLDNVTVQPFRGLLVNFAVEEGAEVIMRGLRAVSDFEYEFQMSYINHKLNPDIHTIFLPATANGHFISSSFVREIARLHGDITELVPPSVAARLRKYFAEERT
jgi:pantetheine-phosphate adenylyltransferase